MIFFGTAKNGHFLPLNKDRLKEFLIGLNGKEISVEIKKKVKSRSSSQNKYYFGVVLLILGGYLGYEVEEIHEICKSQFLKDYKTIGEIEYEYIRSTTSLSTVEFEDYLEKIRRWSSKKFDCYIPNPGEMI